MGMRRWTWLIVAGAALAGCKSSTSTTGAHTLALLVTDAGYSPALDSVSAGAQLTWTWAGVQAHDLVFQDGLDSVALQTTGTHQRLFSAPGVYRYRCTVHSPDFNSGMIGTIVVY
jgi:plastocyanin